MRSAYVQATRPLTIRTSLAEDTFIVLGMEGREAISDVYRFEVDLVAERHKAIDFKELLGKSATLSLEHDGDNKKRYFCGIVCAVQQGTNVSATEDGRPHEYSRFRISIVPKLWLLSQSRRSRIFQRQTVVDILKKVLEDCNADFQIEAKFEPRDYCVQYRETDLNFAKRLMEEEGIFFFFNHTDSEHRMIVRKTIPQQGKTEAFQYESQDSMRREKNRIFSWRKTQEIRPGKYSLRDYNFELPDKQFEESKGMQNSVQIGAAIHKLNAVGEKYEIYDHPGGYAGRFDGISKDGQEQPAPLQHIFDEARKSAALAMEIEAATAVQIWGESSASAFTAGDIFELQRHFSDNGTFTLMSVTHNMRQPIGTNPDAKPFEYRNEFTCIPIGLPYRPRRLTPVPVVHGTQSAVVVGPKGEEIFADKYSRVKVQFRWDRDGKFDTGSSCWVRVASTWAGRNWGAIHIPRIGQEVVVAFEEGDPNQPIIVGSVYNADNLPPYQLPANMTQSGVKSYSTPRGSGSNELRFEDKKDNEEIFLHAQKDLLSTIENNETRTVKNDRTTTITGDDTKTIQRGNEQITLDQGNQTLTIRQGDQKITLSAGNHTTSISLGKSETEAMQSIELKVGQSSVKLDQSGVTIKGLVVKIEAEIEAELKGTITQVKGDAMLMAKGGVVMIN